jgi:hypothetical protein
MFGFVVGTGNRPMVGTRSGSRGNSVVAKQVPGTYSQQDEYREGKQYFGAAGGYIL